MKDFITNLIGAFLLVGMIIWSLVFTLGGAEILRWIIYGDFFHFVG